MSPELLNSKLINIKVDSLLIDGKTLSENINGSTITLAFPYNTKNQSSYFNLDSLTKNDIDTSGIRITEIPNERKPIPNKDGIDLRRKDSSVNINDLAISKNDYFEKIDYASQTFSSEKILNKRNCPLLRMIIGVINLALLAAAIVTFLLNVPLAVPIVLTVLFVVSTILLFGWKKVLPKILPKSWLLKINLGININEKTENKIKSENEKDEEIWQENENQNKLDIQ